LLVLDEPTLGLAPVVVQEVREVLLGLKPTGLSLLLVEQNASVALSISEHAYVLQHGKVAASGPSADLATSESVAALYLASDDPVAVGASRRTYAEGDVLPWMQ
jgi:branched-chain amino acid transport system ATP-binding protein